MIRRAIRSILDFTAPLAWRGLAEAIGVIREQSATVARQAADLARLESAYERGTKEAAHLRLGIEAALKLPDVTCSARAVLRALLPVEVNPVMVCEAPAKPASWPPKGPWSIG